MLFHPITWLDVCELPNQAVDAWTVDAYSKYPCIHMTGSTSTKETLEQDFAHFGYLHTLVTDNTTTFTAQEFHAWCKARGIIHLTGAPHHPAINEVAERLVQTFKKYPMEVEFTTERSYSGIPNAALKDPTRIWIFTQWAIEWEADSYQAGCNSAISSSRGAGYSA